MGKVPLLDELAIVTALAVAVTVLLSKLRLPTVAGLLAAGALVGPFGLRLVTSVHAIEVLAEVGVVLLLFSIGLEFSLSRLRDIFRSVALGGALQVTLTIGATVGVASAAGETLPRALFYGFVFALSSTAIVLRALSDRRELEAPHGRFIVGTLVFQDLCVVPMVLVVPLLGPGAGSGASAAAGIALALGKAAAVVVGTIVVARVVVPRVLRWVDASRSRELFLLAILGLCIGTAWLTSLVELSLALGAFLGGMVVADTEYSHRAMGDILPLRDAFVSLFFVSLGMLFDVRVVAAQPLLVAALLGGFVLVKGVLAALSAMAMRFPSRVAWLSGVGLAQFGEFGFVLARLGVAHGVVSDTDVSPLFAAGIVSMFFAPLLVRVAPLAKAGERLLAPLERLIGVRSIDAPDRSEAKLEGHVVLVGFGPAGRFSAQALDACGVRYVILDLNTDNVRAGKALGVPVYYGDATSEEALAHAGVASAKLLVLVIGDPQAQKRIVDTARRLAPGVRVLARTRFAAERGELAALGADDVVAEEVEGAVEVVARTLRALEVPRNVIDERIHELRTADQPSARRQTVPRPVLGDVRALDDLKIEGLLVRAGSAAATRPLVALRLRSVTGALVVAARRGSELLDRPDPHVPFEANDIVYLVGSGEAIARASRLLTTETPKAP
ncbi:MAG: cation:proton antiporter [Polyangiaceae bacterium]|nr:cation:proton antiporter [Polyangiaceae bacterium]